MSELKLSVWFIVLLLNGIMVGCVSVMICIDGVSKAGSGEMLIVESTFDRREHVGYI